VIKRVHGELGQHDKLFRVTPACFTLNELTGLLDALANGQQINDYMDYGCTLLPARIPVVVKQIDEDDGAACVSQSDAGQGCMWVPGAALNPSAIP
jgi:hypothetical protein